MGIKNNMDEGNNFDAALGMFITREGIIDNVRIYCKELNIKNIKIVHEKYLEEIERLQ